MVGVSAQILLPTDYYPHYKGRWMVEIVDRVGGDADDSGPVRVKVVMLAGPNKKQIGTMVELPVTHTAGPLSLCQALQKNFPKAKTPLDIYLKMSHYVCVYGALAPKTATLHTKSDTKWKPATVLKPSLAFVSLAALQTMAWTATKAVLKDMESPLPAQP
eukprot:1494054-Rhodomonas_salina.3